MEQGQGVEVVGYRWISNRGPNACRDCASLHGREFYHRPKAGQLSFIQMPTPPLHPNCRCTREEIVELNIEPIPVEPKTDFGEFGLGDDATDKIKPEAILTVNDGDGGGVFLGLRWGEDGRGWLNGPAYGLYGGGDRSRGFNTEGMTDEEVEQLIEVKPVDKMDRAYQIHDRGYRECRRTHSGYFENFRCNRSVDKKVADALRALPIDPDQWGRGKLTSLEREYAVKYREQALDWFEWMEIISDTLSMFDEIDLQEIPVSP